MENPLSARRVAAGGIIAVIALFTTAIPAPVLAAGTPGNLCSEGWSVGEKTWYYHNGHYDTVHFQGHQGSFPHYHYWYDETHQKNLAPTSCGWG